jgi:hypothetical protein
VQSQKEYDPRLRERPPASLLEAMVGTGADSVSTGLCANSTSQARPCGCAVQSLACVGSVAWR